MLISIKIRCRCGTVHLIGPVLRDRRRPYRPGFEASGWNTGPCICRRSYAGRGYVDVDPPARPVREWVVRMLDTLGLPELSSFARRQYRNLLSWWRIRRAQQRFADALHAMARRPN